MVVRWFNRKKKKEEKKNGKDEKEEQKSRIEQSDEKAEAVYSGIEGHIEKLREMADKIKDKKYRCESEP